MKIIIEQLRSSVDLFDKPNIKNIIKAYDDIDKQWLIKIKELTQHTQGDEKHASIKQLKKSTEETVEFVRRLQQEEESIKKYAAIMFLAGWPPILEFTNTQVQFLVKEYENNSFDDFRQELDKELMECFNDNYLKGKLSEWRENTFLKGRIHILESAIEAHITRNYYLSVPVMLIQFEGIIADEYHDRGPLRDDKLKKYISKLYLNDDALYPFPDNAREYFDDNIFSAFQWGTPFISRSNRCSILRGADSGYGTELASLKTIMLFDFLLTTITMDKTPII
jgi:hypothetical protein